MVVLFPGAPQSVVGMAVAMEAAKLVTPGWLARRWRTTAAVWRVTLVALVAGLAVINATGVYAQMAAAHLSERGAATSTIQTQDAAFAALIDVQAHPVADLDRRLGQIDSGSGESVARPTPPYPRWKPSAGPARASWMSETARPALSLKAERASLAAQTPPTETASPPLPSALFAH